MNIDITPNLEWCNVKEKNQAVTFKGDYTSQQIILVYVKDDLIIVRDSWEKLFDEVEFNTVSIAKDMCGMFLRTSFIPPPYTIFSNVFLLTVGDYLQIKGKGEKSKIKYWTDYPFFNFKSTGKNKVNLSRVESVIKKSVIKGINKLNKDYDNIYLMHSAGKDSNAILYSIYDELREKLTCVTYNADIKEREYQITKEICKDLGVEHICINSNPTEEFDVFIDFIGQAKSITGDFVFPGYVYTMNKLNGGNNLILDGLGSDIYMGTPLPRLNKYFNFLSIPLKLEKLWGYDLGSFENYKLNYISQSLFMFPSERLFPSIRLSKNEIESLLGIEVVELRQFYKRLSELRETLNEADWRSFLTRLFETGSSMEKGRLASHVTGNDIFFPFCDKDIIDYFFHLPLSEKFSSKINKLPIRNYLKEKTNYNKYVKNKGSFRYDMVNFINTNKEKILDEIHSCRLFKTRRGNIPSVLDNTETRVGSNKVYLMFVLASWINRNDFTFTKSHLLNTRK